MAGLKIKENATIVGISFVSDIKGINIIIKTDVSPATILIIKFFHKF